MNTVLPTLIRPMLTAAIVALALSGLPAQAKQPLADDAHINSSLMAAGVGDTIRRNCPTISARIFVALRKVKALERYAIGLGYSKDEIGDFIGSKPQRKRISEEVRAYMIENGVVEGQKETYCSLGRAEIAKRSLIGQLIWSW